MPSAADAATTTHVPTLRARNRAAIEAAIMQVATDQLTQVGAAALSLRAIARELGMVSSALYRYVANRDDLLTRLIVVAYNDLGDTLDANLRDVVPTHPADLRARFGVIASTFRAWALAHPAQFALIYGSPVPGYQAPAELTNTPGTRLATRLLELAAAATGIPDIPRTTPALQARGAMAQTDIVLDYEAAGIDFDPAVIQRGIQAWHLVQGAVTSELFQQLGPRPHQDDSFAAVLDLAGALLFDDA